MVIDYPHRRGIHCETGSIRNLLKFYGLDLPEEIIFGIGSGYDFINFPFGFVPGTNESVIYRTRSTKILSQFSKRMNIKYKTHSFFSEKNAMDKLDSLLERGIPAAILADIYLLPYFAEFSAGDRFPEHHAIVVGKENGEYIISDTHYLLRGGLNRISIDELRIARFAKAGLMSTRGRMYYIESIPKEFDIKAAIIKGIKETCYKMLDISLPFFGVKGMYFLAKRMRKYEERYGTKNTWATLKMQLRLAEDAGTGGSGFRYVYSNFLEQAAEYFDNDPQLLSISDYFREIGDKRQILALETIRQHEGRNERNIDILADMNYAIAQMEEKAFTDLRKWVKKQK